MLKTYEIGGLPIAVRMAEDLTDDGLLAPFLCQTEKLPVYTLDITCSAAIPRPRGTLIGCDAEKRIYLADDGATYQRFVGAVERSTDGAYLCIERCGDHAAALYNGDKITPRVLLTAMEGEHLITLHGGILLHASCVCLHGNAILFTAPSGTGKSTQADLWQTHRGAEIINGDRIAVFCDDTGALRVRGVPYSGSSGIAKAADLPLCAIVCLRQGTENRPHTMRGMEAFRALWGGCCVNTWLREDVDSASMTVSRIVSAARILSFACTPDVTAVEALEKAFTDSVEGGMSDDEKTN